MRRSAPSLTVSLPPDLLREAEQVAREENRSKSELVRDALQLYIEERRWRKVQREISARAQAVGIRSENDVDTLIHSMRK